MGVSYSAILDEITVEAPPFKSDTSQLNDKLYSLTKYSENKLGISLFLVQILALPLPSWDDSGKLV